MSARVARRAWTLWLSVAATVTIGLATASPAGAVGELTQKAGIAGCISDDGADPADGMTGGVCTDGHVPGAAYGMAISPDGTSAYATAYNGNAVLLFDRNPGTGALTQKAGTAGCISQDGTGGTCQVGNALTGAAGVLVSPDSRSVYVTSNGSDAVAVFDRDTTTGALTQKVGTAGCVSDDGTLGTCQNGNGLDGVFGFVVSPDGRSAYAGSVLGDAMVVFDRDPATGALTQKAGTAGCISDTGAGGCQDGNAMDGVYTVAMSPDGASVYATSESSDSVLVFDRDPATGALAQKAGTAGCVSDDGTGGCQDGNALNGAFGRAVAPDGATVYATGSFSNSVAVFDRNPGTGALTQKAGTAGCISSAGAGGCQNSSALDMAGGVVVSPDGAAVYVTSADSDALVTFDRDSGTGALTRKAGMGGCISETGAGGCQDGRGLGGALGVAVSPDGSSVYVASITSNAVAVFDRVGGRPGAYRELAPSRVLDTRLAIGAPAGPVGPNGQLELQVLGRGGVPATGVSAVVLNVTVTKSTAPGFITVWASGTPKPNASNVNYATNQTTANLVVAPVGANGKVSFFNGSAGTTHLIADVSGYFLRDDR